MRETCELINGHMHKLSGGRVFFVFPFFVGIIVFEVFIAIIDNGDKLGSELWWVRHNLVSLRILLGESRVRKGIGS